MSTVIEANTITVQQTTEACQNLLRGEISAVETYNLAIEKYGDQPFADTLRQIRANHLENERLLREHVGWLGSEPATGSGAWGVLVKTLQTGANFFGENASLSVLKTGEEHGAKDYQDALEGELMREAREMIDRVLLPRVQSNLATLESIKEA
ncbi:MAG: DUF2383 domain-containing protein [Verrucomicrobiota bacterium JB023]|nr:DUF2383 domain-containing protein [Verrucomicrobiota bacterium JB023]